MGLVAELEAAGLGEHVATLLPLARPSLLLDPSRCAQSALLRGASRLGGAPDLPPSFDWPSYRGRPHALRVECEQSRSTLPPSPARYHAARPGGHDWELLLQLDTDDAGPGWMWGDSGRIYFCIRKQDLAVQRFDRAWLVLQCY